MSWATENKFLTGFFAVTAIGAGALGFLLFQAKGHYNELYSTYEQDSADLNRLQELKPYPNAENVKKLEEQRKAHVTAIAQLQEKLNKHEIPVENISPAQFQDRLRAAVDEINKRATEARVKLPENFAFGFERYLSSPPSPEAASPLGHQLKAIELAVRTAIQSRGRELEIRSLTRDELPQEQGGAAAETAQPTKGGKSAGKGGKPAPDLVKKYPFGLVLFGDQASFLNAFNKIVAQPEQFYIPRVVSVVNEKQAGPTRAETAAAPSGTPDASGTPVPPVDPSAGTPPTGTPPAGAVARPAAATYIVGEERVEATIRLEIAEFAAPPTPTAK